MRTGAGISLALAAAVHYERREARHCKAEQRLNLGTIRAIGPAEKDANNKPCHAVNGPIVWWQLCAECGRFNGDTSLSIDWTEGGDGCLGLFLRDIVLECVRDVVLFVSFTIVQGVALQDDTSQLLSVLA